LIESHPRDIISELESDTTNSTLILYSVRNNMSSEVRIQILRTVNSMLDEIRHMKENFALESEEKSIRSNISGHLQAIWTTLQDSRPEKMSGYGTMSTLDKELLSPCILNLLTMLEDIYRQLR